MGFTGLLYIYVGSGLLAWSSAPSDRLSSEKNNYSDINITPYNRSYYFNKTTIFFRFNKFRNRIVDICVLLFYNLLEGKGRN